LNDQEDQNGDGGGDHNQAPRPRSSKADACWQIRVDTAGGGGRGNDLDRRDDDLGSGQISTLAQALPRAFGRSPATQP